MCILVAMSIYLVRHATSLTNEDGYVRRNSSLSEKGKRESRLLVNAFKETKIEHIYSSILERAKETASDIAIIKHINVQTLDYIHERISPVHLEGIHKSDQRHRVYEDEFSRNEYTEQYILGDGENFQSLLARSKKLIEFMKHIRTETIIVTHGGLILLSLYEIMTGASCSLTIWKNLMRHIKLLPTSITTIENDEKSGLEVFTIGDICHLK